MATGERDPPMEEVLSSIRDLVSSGGAAGERLTPDPATAAAKGTPAAKPADRPKTGAPLSDGGADTPPPPPPGPRPEAAPAAERLVSEEAEAASVDALADLRGAAEAPPEAPAAADVGARTVEALAADLLRPMLREWLNENLPDIVESAVRAEVRRLSGRIRR